MVEYFKEIALGFEFGGVSRVTRRWEDTMKVFIGGELRPELLTETNKVIGEINELTTNDFAIEVVTDSLVSNFYIFFGSADAYATIYPEVADIVAENFGCFFVYWPYPNIISKGHMYVDIFRTTPSERQHLIREELTQSLGLARDADWYFESIFYQSYTLSTAYAQIDKDLIRLLYHPQMIVGLDAFETDKLLTAILLDEQE